MEGSKAWWTSKTIWANLIALIGSIVLSMGFDPGRWGEISTVVLAAVNVVLRFYTNEEISIAPASKK
jgi:lysylphosphatidylglycerol synthetase-like protein (DUF2156 family)